MIGRTLAHYEILKKIGSGGMGDVYLAKDQKLGRKVALKILPVETATRDRLRRFEQEAKAVAALNHPNIVHVYSVEESEGLHFITMEWVPGKTLAETIPSKGLPLSRFLEIAIPMVDAVSAAHEQGVIHRDLKPENAMLSEEGRVKILDFGLAKLRPEAAGSVVSEAPTLSATREGHIVGTVAYMSPEQAEGKTVDHRTDIFSLGIVLFEMLTGERPFVGETPAAIMSAIIKDVAPSVAELRPDMPRDVSRIVKRCLTKDLGRRFQSAADLRNDFEDLKEALGSGELHEAQPEQRPKAIPWLAAGVAACLLAVVGFLTFREGSGDVAAIRLTNPVQLTSAVGVEDYPTWSADGERLAYHSDQSGNWDIWVSQLGGGDAVNFTADHAGEDRFPSWSPDGRQIAFLSRREATWGVYTMSALGGGSPRKWVTLGEGFPNRQPDWSADGSELVVSVEDKDENFVEIVTLRTQERRRVALPRPEGKLALDLSLAPGGGSFAFVSSSLAASAEVTQILVVPVSGGEATAVTDGTTNDGHPTWSADGTRLFFVSNRGGSMDLWQQSLGPEARPEGAAQPLTTGMGIRSAVFSADGAKLAYSRGRTASNVWRVPILQDRRATWADAEPITSDNALTEGVSVAADGRIFINSDRSGNQDLWMLGSGETEFRQITFEPFLQSGPQVSPDGKEIVFFAFVEGNRDVMVMSADGGPARTLAPHPSADIAPSWSPDGSQIAFASQRSGNRDIWIVDVAGGEPKQVTTDAGSEFAPIFSPDGLWIYFTSNSKIWRVPADGGEPERVTQRGNGARFSSDGKTLYLTDTQSNRATNLWAKSLDDRREYPITDLTGRPGQLWWNFATDGEYLYFVWREEQGDIWVMDVVTDEDATR